MESFRTQYIYIVNCRLCKIIHSGVKKKKKKEKRQGHNKKKIHNIFDEKRRVAVVVKREYFRVDKKSLVKVRGEFSRSLHYDGVIVTQ